MIETMKVKPWGADQGDHVIINAEDFDPKIHTALDEKPAPKPRAKKDAQ
jgi:hypothetical protein